MRESLKAMEHSIDFAHPVMDTYLATRRYKMDYTTMGKPDFDLPTNAEQFEEMKKVMINFGTEDQPEVWYTIASHIQAAKAWQTRMLFQELIDVGRKVIINRVAQDQKVIEGAKIQAKLEEAAKRVVDAIKAEEEKNPTRIIPFFPEADGTDVSDRTRSISSEL